MIKTSFREHRELGEVAWLRDYDAALGKAAASGKPVLLLFQEIPGCSTCVNFGHDVLANPLLAELIEDRFVPLAIYNNQPGRDAEVLRYFGEPAWNNPVVHFLSPSGQDIVPKLANRYDPIGLHGKILTALEALGQDVPEYARLLRGDLLVEYGLSRQLVFETPCFWSGETTLAQHPAVLTTEAGWSGGEEVVRVHFDPALSDASALEAFAVDEGFAPSAGTNFETDKATQYYVKLVAIRFPALERCAANQDQPGDTLPRWTGAFSQPAPARLAELGPSGQMVDETRLSGRFSPAMETASGCYPDVRRIGHIARRDGQDSEMTICARSSAIASDLFDSAEFVPGFPARRLSKLCPPAI